jgi:preprotein translocase subunit SecG
MYSLVLFIHVIICIVLILLILMQRGKGADVGSSFGAGASATMFGAAGSASFLVKLTGAFGILFFLTSLTLGVMSSHIANKNNPIAVAIETAENTKVEAPKQQSTSAPKLPDAPQPVA